MGVPKSIKCTARVKESADRLRREYVEGEGEGTPQVSGVPEGWDGLILRRGFPAGVDRDRVPFPESRPSGYLIGVEMGWHPEGDWLWPPPLQPGQWNRVVIDCGKGTVRVSVNNHLVNEITGLNLKKGRIAFASQWSEYDIHRIIVQPRQPDNQPEKPADKGRP
jgi:hypothetical protein